MTAFVVFAHGSRIEAANEAVRAVSTDLARVLAETGDPIVESAFLELGVPDLPGAVEKLIERGADRIVVIPYFLTLGRHVERDLPRIVHDLSIRHGGIKIEVTAPLDGHPSLLQILLERAQGALA